MTLNVLLITADQWRGDCLSVAGHPHVSTPHMDALAREGVRFTRHYANAAPCAPARASLYTGLYQMNHRVVANGTPLDGRHDNLARAARRAGYAPVLFGHTDSAVDPRECSPDDARLRTYEGVLPGFDTGLALTEEETEWRDWVAGIGIELPPGHPHRGVMTVDDPPAGQAPCYPARHSPTAFMVERLTSWLDHRIEHPDEKVAREPGWFAHLSLLRPHPPFVASPPFNRQVSPEAITDLASGGDWRAAASQHPLTDFLGGRQSKATFIAGAEGAVRDWTPADFRQIAATYFGMVSELDAELGRLFAYLEHRDQWRDTLVVLTSDHGEMLGDHGLLGKGGFHDGSYHIPLVIRDPHHTRWAGREVDAFSEAIDVMPTLLERLELPLPPQLDGRSLQPWLTGETPLWRDAAHWEFDFRDVVGQSAERHFDLDSCRCQLTAQRSVSHKYVHFAGLPPLMFDMLNDPSETCNLAARQDWLVTRASNAEAMLAWRAEHLDQSLALTLLNADGLTRVRRNEPFS